MTEDLEKILDRLLNEGDSIELTKEEGGWSCLFLGFGMSVRKGGVGDTASEAIQAAARRAES